MDTQEENSVLIPPEAEGDGDSTLNEARRQLYFTKYWPCEDRVVEFDEFKKHYEFLKHQCDWRKKRIETEKMFSKSRIKDQIKYEESIAEILAWKNDHKLNVHLKALSGLNKQKNLERRNNGINKLHSRMQFSSTSQTSEWRGHDETILAMKEPDYIINKFFSLVGGVGPLYWSYGHKSYIQPPFEHETNAIMERRRKWLGCSNTSPDEKQMKMLMHDTIRLMFIIKEVVKKVLIGVKAKVKELEEGKNIAPLENELADFEFRKNEVKEIIKNWDSDKSSRDDHQ
ncbi:hypothetical protein ACFE04_019139 [Oxalis oulophora]